MCRHFRVALIVGALAAPGVAAHAQDAKPRTARRPGRSSGRRRRRASPVAAARRSRVRSRRAPAPRAEAPRPAPAPAPLSATASSGDSNRRARRSGVTQSRQRTSPPPDRRGSGDGDRAVARRGGSPGGEARRGCAGPRHRARQRRTSELRDGHCTPLSATAWLWRRRRLLPAAGTTWYYPYYPLSYGFFWDPWWGYGYPYGGYGYGHGYGLGYGSGYGYGYGGYGAYQGPTYQIYGGLRLKVKPREAEVFVDGYFAGVVDDFDGAFQQLNLDVGPAPHRAAGRGLRVDQLRDPHAAGREDHLQGRAQAESREAHARFPTG